MKVPELEEQQGRNIFLLRSEYLSTTMLPWTTPSLYKKKLFTLYGPRTRLKFQFGPTTTYSGVVVRERRTYISSFWSSSTLDPLLTHCWRGSAVVAKYWKFLDSWTPCIYPSVHLPHFSYIYILYLSLGVQKSMLDQVSMLDLPTLRPNIFTRR